MIHTEKSLAKFSTKPAMSNKLSFIAVDKQIIALFVMIFGINTTHDILNNF